MKNKIWKKNCYIIKKKWCLIFSISWDGDIYLSILRGSSCVFQLQVVVLCIWLYKAHTCQPYRFTQPNTLENIIFYSNNGLTLKREILNIFVRFKCFYKWYKKYSGILNNYLCNKCLSPLKLWVQLPPMVRCTRYNIIWLSLSVTFCGFLPGIPMSSTNKTEWHDITVILLKLALNNIIQNSQNTTIRDLKIAGYMAYSRLLSIAGRWFSPGLRFPPPIKLTITI
jgi:hypothetical protein